MDGPTALLVVGAAVPVVGFLTAVLARRIVAWWRPPTLGWAASTLCGIVGSAAGASLAALAMGRPLRDAPVRVVLAGLAGTVLLVGIVELLWPRPPEPPASVESLVRAGESDRVEFKSSGRFNRRTRAKDARLELVVATTVAAFRNGRGGQLVIGVADDGEVLGVEDDYALLRHQDRDGFELWLRDLLTSTLGVTTAHAVDVRFERVAGHDVCVVHAPSAQHPVYLRPNGSQRTEFHVRVGNSSRHLDARETVEYASTRWNRRHLGTHPGDRSVSAPPS